MDIGIISVRYSRALLLFSKELGEEDVVYKEFGRLTDSFAHLPQLHNAMSNPALALDKKVELLALAIAPSGKLSTTSDRFLKLVVAHHRAEFLVFMANTFLDLYREDRHIVRAKLTTPVEVDRSIQQRIKELLNDGNNRNVELNTVVDAGIKGGFILEYKTYRLDASLASQLEHIRRSLKK